MKKLMYWSRNTLLPLCLLLVFGLMSCQQDEIIPLKEDDLVENPIGDIPELDMENPAGVVVDEKGNIVGYYDSQNNRYDQDGNLSNQKTTAYNSNDRLLAVLYDQESYKGISMMYFLQSSQTSLNIRDLRITGNFDNRARSMVVGPDVNIQLFEHSGYRGERISQGQFNSSPHYIPSLSSYISGKASSLRIRTTSGSNANGSTFCGMLFDNGRWSRGNAHIPIFKGNELKLADYGLDNRVSSYAANDNSNCSGVMLYDHVSDLGQNYHWASRGEDIDYFSSHSSGMDNKISRVVETTQIDHDYRRLARNKKVGLITFSRSNFEGNPTIYYQGTDISTSFFGWKIYSYVVAPHTKFRHRSQSGSIQVVSPGGYQNSYLSTDIIKVESQNLSNSAYNDNNYCGELYNDSGGAGGWIRSDRKHIPIFEGLTNYSLADGKKIIKLSNVTGDLNNRGSTFQATDMTTSCSGVTFWKDDGFTNTIIGKRGWFPVDGQKHSLPSGIDNTVSSISVEGCTSNSTGITQDEYIDFVDQIVFDSNNYGSGLRVGKQPWCLAIKRGCDTGRNYYLPYVSDAIGCAVGVVGSLRSFLAPFTNGQSLTSASNGVSIPASVLLPSVSWDREKWIRFGEAIATGRYRPSSTSNTMYTVPGNIYKSMVQSGGILLGAALMGNVAGMQLDRGMSWASGFSGQNCQQLYDNCMDNGELDNMGDKP